MPIHRHRKEEENTELKTAGIAALICIAAGIGAFIVTDGGESLNEIISGDDQKADFTATVSNVITDSDTSATVTLKSTGDGDVSSRSITVYDLETGETAHSGNTPQADEALWDLIPAMTSSVKSGLESKFGLTVPASVTILGTGQEDLVNYCSEHSDTQTIVFMSEYNIRATNKNSWWDNCQAIESNTSGNIQFIFTLSNSPAMVLSTIEMIGKVIGSDNTDAMMTSILAEIYVMQKAIDGSGKEISFYCETASGNSVGSNTLMGGIFSSILKMENVFDGSLMGSKMSDEQIISAEPDVIGFYTSDTRSMDEKMRAA